MTDYYISKKRLLTLFVTAIFLFFVIFCRLFYIQVFWGQDLQQKAMDQWTRDLPLTAMRGNIVDTNGNVLANSVTAYGIYIRPQSVTDANRVAEVLSSVLGLDYQSVYDKATKRGVSEVTAKKQVSYELAQTVRGYDLEGVYFA